MYTDVYEHMYSYIRLCLMHHTHIYKYTRIRYYIYINSGILVYDDDDDLLYRNIIASTLLECVLSSILLIYNNNNNNNNKNNK